MAVRVVIIPYRVWEEKEEGELVDGVGYEEEERLPECYSGF